MKYLIIILFLFNSCYVYSNNIVDKQKHRHNVAIINEIIAQELKDVGQTSPADHLSQRIAEIGQKALKQGFDISAYSYYQSGPRRSLSYSAAPLWEGKQIPLTLYVYLWPSEKEAQKRDPTSTEHMTPIHDHAIPCALTVLQGSINQLIYEPLPNHTARFIEEETLTIGDATLDDNTHVLPFVHSLVSRNEGAVTLHAYGAGTDRQVYQIFSTAPSYQESYGSKDLK